MQEEPMALTNQQYDTIMRQYDKKQADMRHIARLRKEELYALSPRLVEIDRQISTNSVTQAKKLLEGDDNALYDLKEEISRLTAEKKAVIHSLGYSEDYLTPPYSCPDCKDTGFIDGRKCHCFIKASIDLLYMQSNVKEALDRENFATFSYSYYSTEDKDEITGLSSYEMIKSTIRQCQTFIQNFNKEFHNIYLYGSTGVGKTFLTHCITKEILEQGYSVIYLTAFELFDLLSRNTFDREADVSEECEYILNCDLLVIDDLGTEFTNSFVSSQLFLYLNERIIRRKSTIISTNLALNELQNLYSERTFSRIFSNYTIIKLFGEDIRIKKKLTGHTG
jgi:DNA replication protein DnaC